MKVAQKVVRRHSEVSVYKEPGQDVYYYRVKIHGRRFKRSTGQTTRHAALAQARKIRLELLADGKGLSTMKRPGIATVGEVLRVWLERSPARTAKNNASAVRKWVRSFAGGDADAVSMTRLTGEALERYLEAWPGSPEGRVSTWRQIRAVWAPAAVRWYEQEGLTLPDVTGLRELRVRVAAREREFAGFTLIPAETLTRMDAWAERLRRSKSLELRRVWGAYALMRWCGLRNSEVAALRWEWLVRGAEHYLWRFCRRQLEDGTWYVPKGSAGDVPVRRRLLGQLRYALKTRRRGYVIPRANVTDAEVLTHRSLNRFVRRFLPDRAKGAYELRKQFGAQIAQRSGLEVASRVLRHQDIKTTWKHYHALLNEPAPL